MLVQVFGLETAVNGLCLVKDAVSMCENLFKLTDSLLLLDVLQGALEIQRLQFYEVKDLLELVAQGHFLFAFL